MEKDKNRYEKVDDKDEKKFKSKKKSSTNDVSDDSENKRKNDDEINSDKTKQEDRAGLAHLFDTADSDRHDSYDETQDEIDVIPNLSEEELHEATIAIVDARMQEVAEEIATVEPDSSEEFEALANAVFLESLQELAEGSDTIGSDLIDDAFQESLEDLSMSGENISENDNGYELQDITENQPIPDTDNDNQIVPLEGSTTPMAAGNTAHPQPLPSPNNGVLSPRSTPSPSVPRQPNYYASQNTQNIPAQQFNTNPVVINEIHNHRSDMLVGVVLGYIIGRRGGRKRTEKKLQPIMTKLEKQISDLHYIITVKEEKIRILARQKAEEYARRRREESKNEVGSEVKLYNSSVAHEVVERRLIKKKVKEQLKRREELSKDPGVEKIGRFSLPALKVFHEKRLPDGSENSPKRKQVEVMTEAELLDKVAGLKIHGLDVASMYERKRLTLESLRQITKEYLRGGPFKQTFSLELLPDEREIADKKQQVHVAHDKVHPVNRNQITTSNQPEINVQKATKLADALLAQQPKSEKNYTNSSVKYGVIAGIAGAFIILYILLTV